jgi:FkbM family methyltransferase
VLQGKSSDWALELSRIEYSPFFRYYSPQVGDRVVSVGAGIGTEAFILSRRIGPSGRVLAIEGDPTAFAQLAMGIQLNNFENVLPFFGLVTNQSKWTDMQLGYIHGADFTTSNILQGQSKGVKFMGFTLDQVLALTGFLEPDLLLMNIEGAEVLALEGLSSLPKRIVVSCHDFLNKPEATTYARVCRWLIENGYKTSAFDKKPGMPWEEYYIFGQKVL